MSCPFCGRDEPHEHILSEALPPGNHPTYEELMIQKRPDFAAWCKEEREAGNGGCGACVLCCKELKDRLDTLEIRIEALRSACTNTVVCQFCGAIWGADEPCDDDCVLHRLLVDSYRGGDEDEGEQGDEGTQA